MLLDILAVVAVVASAALVLLDRPATPAPNITPDEIRAFRARCAEMKG